MTVAYSAAWERRALQQRVMPMIRGVVERHRPMLEEWSVDLAPGREVLIRELLAPLAALPPVRVFVVPSGPPRPCAHCWGQRKLWESGILGLCPIVCERCAGSGWDPS